MFTIPPHHGPGGLGFTNDTTKLRAEWLNYVGGAFPNAIDVIGGGYYQRGSTDLRISSGSSEIKFNAPAVADPISLRGFVTIGLSDDVNYPLGLGTLTVSSPATFSSTATFTAGVTLNAATTFNFLGTFTKGISVTQSTSNTDAITATGNGTGQGIDAIGGTTNASGGKFTGGTTNGYGVECYGTGAGLGGYFKGGATGRGVYCEAGGGNAVGVQGVGAGTSGGVYGIGGSTGPGGIFIGNVGDATAEAIRANGYITLNGTDVSPSVDPGTNRIYPALVTKAWAKVSTNGAGNVTKSGNVGVSLVAISGSNIRVTLAHAMADAEYAIQLTNGNGSLFATFSVNGQTTTTIDVIAKRDNGTAAGLTYNPVTTAYTFHISVNGRH